ncbi:14535_t:CDS:2 [Entrophospora sp. SA101]|nr:15843_t:CDS:2 [Entrophospora sp. SA101]CAJ0754620.1 14535_t:CDS:2 [Entrophospora sp. SA101]
MTVSTTSAQHRNNTHQLQHRHQLNHPLQRRNNHQLHHPNGHHHLHIHNQKLSDTGIPVSFILQELYHLSPIFYNNKSKCAIQLHITGLPKIFHIHKEYLIFQSICFRKIFETLSVYFNKLSLTQLLLVQKRENFPTLLQSPIILILPRFNDDNTMQSVTRGKLKVQEVSNTVNATTVRITKASKRKALASIGKGNVEFEDAGTGSQQEFVDASATTKGKEN